MRVSFPFQSTPVGSIQTGHEVVVSPNRDRHAAANKVNLSPRLWYTTRHMHTSSCNSIVLQSLNGVIFIIFIGATIEIFKGFKEVHAYTIFFNSMQRG